jgi:hypothetical protein
MKQVQSIWPVCPECWREEEEEAEEDDAGGSDLRSRSGLARE